MKTRRRYSCCVVCFRLLANGGPLVQDGDLLLHLLGERHVGADLLTQSLDQGAKHDLLGVLEGGGLVRLHGLLGVPVVHVRHVQGLGVLHEHGLVGLQAGLHAAAHGGELRHHAHGVAVLALRHLRHDAVELRLDLGGHLLLLEGLLLLLLLQVRAHVHAGRHLAVTGSAAAGHRGLLRSHHRIVVLDIVVVVVLHDLHHHVHEVGVEAGRGDGNDGGQC